MKEGVVRVADPLQSPWLIAVFLVMLILLAWTNLRGAQKLRLMIRTSLMVRPPRLIFREDLDMQDRLVFILLAMSVFSMSIFIYQVGVLSGSLAPIQSTLLFVFAIVLLVVLVSILSVRIAGMVFNSTDGLAQYVNHCILQFILLGLILLPISLILAFSPIPRDIVVNIGIGLIAAWIVLRWIRGVSLGINAGIPTLYIVLYLCAAEILPALIGLRYLDVSPLV